jgi:hypothetical protein
MRALAAAGLLLALGCATAPTPMPPTQAPAADPARALLAAHPGLAAVLGQAERHRLQLVLGTLEPGPGGRPRLVQHGFRAGAEYFYPASSVKLFAAVAALERLAELRQETGLPLDADTPLVYHPVLPGDALEDSDPTNLENGKITVRHEIRKLFLVSDNEAFNRLYELVGQDRLAASLTRAGLPGARLVHRLAEARSAEENRRFPRIELRGEGFVYALPERTSAPLPAAPTVPGLAIGRAHLDGETKVEDPLDFTGKNRIALADLQRGLCMVVRPDVDCGGPGFTLAPADRALLLEAMRRLPRQSTNPVYPPAEYPDDYVKFLLPGLLRVAPLERWAISNKIGQAYGFTVENAWVLDEGSGRGAFLAAALYTNEDEVLNDDRYEYTTVALPFLADLGEALARTVLAAQP